MKIIMINLRYRNNFLSKYSSDYLGIIDYEKHIEFYYQT